MLQKKNPKKKTSWAYLSSNYSKVSKKNNISVIEMCALCALVLNEILWNRNLVTHSIDLDPVLGIVKI